MGNWEEPPPDMRRLRPDLGAVQRVVILHEVTAAHHRG
jgi:hypothetical protein